MATCAVRTCQNSPAKRRDLPFFPFPTDPIFREIWMRFCGLSGWEMENFIICGQHFTPECYLKPLNTLESIQERPKLYNCAVPTIVYPPPPPKTFQETYKRMIGGRTTQVNKTATTPCLSSTSSSSSSQLNLTFSCRVCLVRMRNRSSSCPLDNQEARDILFKCTSVRVEPGDQCPQQLCMKCWTKCIRWSDFQMLAQATDRKLKLSVEKMTSDAYGGMMIVMGEPDMCGGGKEIDEEQEQVDVENLLCVNVMEMVSPAPEPPVSHMNEMDMVRPAPEPPVNMNEMEIVRPVPKPPVNMFVLAEVAQEEVISLKAEPVEYLEGYSLAPEEVKVEEEEEELVVAPSIRVPDPMIRLQPLPTKGVVEIAPIERLEVEETPSHAINTRPRSCKKITKYDIEIKGYKAKKTFTPKSKRRAHQYIYKCYPCKIGFADQATLYSHNISKHPGNRNVKCELCNQTFKSRCELADHLLTLHTVKA